MAKSILVVGNGAREHAIIWKLVQSIRVGQVYAAPGNGGTREIATNVNIQSTNIKELLNFAEKKCIDLTVVGPDNALALGIVDQFNYRGLPIFGPTKRAAKIESSKIFAKKIMGAAKIPTANFQHYLSASRALNNSKKWEYPVVIKANGLALGKGVFICHSQIQAEKAIRKLMVQKNFGESGEQILVEEYLLGPEISIHVLTDGTAIKVFPVSRDHKALFNGKEWENTGGMGAFCPVPEIANHLLRKIQLKAVNPILKYLAQNWAEFNGCLYPGIKLTPDGPKVVEFNARFGDPEIQVYLRLLESDLYTVFEACVNKELDKIKLKWKPKFAVTVTLASQGYPNEFEKGFLITGIERAEKIEGVVVFHAGTEFSDKLITNGGRVLSVSAIGQTLEQARELAYAGVREINFKGMVFRNDIAKY